jgi:hypothetical protein
MVEREAVWVRVAAAGVEVADIGFLSESVSKFRVSRNVKKSKSQNVKKVKGLPVRIHGACGGGARTKTVLGM